MSWRSPSDSRGRSFSHATRSPNATEPPAGRPIRHLQIEVLRRPIESTQYQSWVFGHRLRAAGLLGSMGRVASSIDNCLMESFFSTLQRELLDTRRWNSRAELGSAIFEWIECWYNPRRRHTALGNKSPVAYEDQLHASQALSITAEPAA